MTSSTKRLEILERLIAAGSTDPFHHYARALELRSLGRKEDAFEALCDVATRFDRYVPSYLMAAQLAHELGRRELAVQMCRRGIEEAARARDVHAQSELETFLRTLEE